ncbi:MAG: fumarylacetoacetate hydrolase family protein [Sulfurifustaceae bacterium]
MHLVTFSDDAGERIGAWTADRREVVDLAATGSNVPRTMLDLIRAGAPGLAAARAALSAPRRALASVRLHAPIPRPAKNIFCVGKNYKEHAREFHGSGFDATAKEAIPEAPIVFTKAPTAVVAGGAAILASLDDTGSTDYEGELAVVIGKGGRGIGKAHAYAHVFGYTIINDVTSRTLQRRHAQWFIGKSIDGFCPMGPAIVTADEIPDVSALRLITRVNGEVRQDASVADLIFDIPTLIETLSKRMTLEPGDLIATGTCAGVGIGFTPPKFLKPGDRVAVTIEPIGTLENPVA